MRRFKKISTQAFILPIVLFFIQLFALLGIYGLKVAQIEFRANKDAWQHEQYRKAALNILSAIENNFMVEKPTCVVASPVNFNEKSIEWWQSTACSGNLAGNQYYYVFEFLGEDICAAIQATAGKEVIPQYYRITLLLLPEKKINIRMTLQSTLAIAGSKVPTCQERTHVVTVGRQMWRQLG